MLERRSVAIRPMKPATEGLGFFRFGKVGERVIVTNDAGQWHTLTEADFRAFVEGTMPHEHPEWAALHQKCFVRRPGDVAEISSRVRDRYGFLGRGPHLHVMVTTLRCNQGCGYCHASRLPMDRHDADMDVETARTVVERVLDTPNPNIVIEFQGGEPTAAFDVIQASVEHARAKKKPHQKIVFSLITNFTSMDEDKANWLIDNEVLVCTSLDGPEALHNANRAWTGGGSAQASVLSWISWFNKAYIARGKDPDLWHVDALMTTTRATLSQWKEVVDLYVSLGIRTVHFRPLNPYGFAEKSWNKIGYTMDEFLETYAKVLDYVIALNKEGVSIQEGTAATFLQKLLTPHDPNYVDIRSPCGAGTGQVAWMHDGSVYPCDEARMLAATGDPTFRLGDVHDLSMADVLMHPTVKSMALASTLDSLPMCSDCWAKPFCGVCPIHTWRNEKDLFGQRPSSSMCHRFLKTLEMVVARMDADTDGSTLRVFHRWTLRREQVQHPEDTCA